MRKQTAEILYLDLLKMTLSYTLWPEPATPLETFNYRRSPLKKAIIATLSRLLRVKNLQLGLRNNYTQEQRNAGEIWPLYADTMIGRRRLDNLQYCIETVMQDDVEGDCIETGVWRGGACIFMRAVLQAYGDETRKVFVADSFEGLPKPDIDLYPDDKGDTHHTHDYLAISQAEVEGNFRKYGLLDAQVVFLKGWFESTLPQAPIQKLAILRLDGDMYSSTIEALENLYPKLSSGGFCIIDDYALSGCQKAVSDYRGQHGIDEALQAIDRNGVFWRKT